MRLPRDHILATDQFQPRQESLDYSLDKLPYEKDKRMWKILEAQQDFPIMEIKEARRKMNERIAEVHRRRKEAAAESRTKVRTFVKHTGARNKRMLAMWKKCGDFAEVARAFGLCRKHTTNIVKGLLDEERRGSA